MFTKKKMPLKKAKQKKDNYEKKNTRLHFFLYQLNKEKKCYKTRNTKKIKKK